MFTNTLTGIAGVHVTTSRRVTAVVVITHNALVCGTTRGRHSVTSAVRLGEEVHIHKASRVQETSGDLRSTRPLGGLSKIIKDKILLRLCAEEQVVRTRV